MLSIRVPIFAYLPICLLIINYNFRKFVYRILGHNQLCISESICISELYTYLAPITNG